MKLNFQHAQKFFNIYKNAGKNCFDFQIAKCVELKQFGNQEILFEMIVKQEFCNRKGGMYGGALSTLLDFVTSFNLIIHDSEFRDSVSLNLNTTFIRPVLLNEKIKIISKTKQIGRKISLAEFEVLGKTDKLLSQGSHQAFMLSPFKYENQNIGDILGINQ